MTGADARRIVRELGADDAVAKVVADAGPLSDEQIVVLRGILLAPDATKAAFPGRPSSSLTDHRGSRRDDDSGRS